MKSITVYCSASPCVDARYHERAEAMGHEIGRRRIELVFGGGSVGLMSSVARCAKAAGGVVTGIITSRLVGIEIGWKQCDELIVVDTMRERKQLLEMRGDAFLILPGGLGTYEEFFEVLVGRKLREHSKPIGIMNVYGYFDPLFDLINHGVGQHFVDASVHSIFTVGVDPSDLLDRLSTWRADVGCVPLEPQATGGTPATPHSPKGSDRLDCAIDGRRCDANI